MILTEFDQKGYEEFIREEAREEHARESVLMLLSRFGEIPDSIEEAVKGIGKESSLNALLLAAVDAKTFEEFEQELSKYS